MSRQLAALTPGVQLGPYPEKSDPELSSLAASLRSAWGVIAKRLHPRRRAFRRITRAINGLAGSFEAMSEADLSRQAKRLGLELRRQGLEDSLLIEAFALIREVSGRMLGMRHFDAQLMGGWAMMRGMIAEMQTGEGKTLTATLPACCAGLAGIPVHVVTVNDYLVCRDAEKMSPVYAFFGLKVGTITEEMDLEARRQAYACDVTYCTNKQIAFDYLKDRMVLKQRRGALSLKLEQLYDDDARVERLLMPGLCFAIVDEADSVMIDEAQTPLILSAPQANPEANAGRYADALEIARTFERKVDYTLNQRHRHVELTETGHERLEEIGEIYKGPWRSSRFSEELVVKALTALHCHVIDEHYIIEDGKVTIVDEFTGRRMPDRSWEQGLHQLIEIKEGCDLTAPNETIARISYQQFFRRYLMLAGMTGTAFGVEGELWSVYDLKVARIPTNEPNRRTMRRDRLFLNREDKWEAVVARIRAVHATGQPVLVGTRSVSSSELLSAKLEECGLVHTVLNARQDAEEAEVISRAGCLGAVTIATNMAGRGTDIELADGVAELGGLHVIATERSESSRIDRQLFGRSGRQGNPGSGEAFLSLDDELIVRYCAEWLARRGAGARTGAARTVNYLLGRQIVGFSQWAAERQSSQIRKGLTSSDQKRSKSLSFAGLSE